MAPESSFFSCLGLSNLSWLLKTLLNFRSSLVCLYQVSEIAKIRYKHSVSRSLLRELKSKNSLKVCFVFASCLILDTHSSTISIFSWLRFGSFISVSSSYITFLGPSLWIKYLAFTVLPFSRLAIENRQLSLSLINSAGALLFLLGVAVPDVWLTIVSDFFSSLSISGVSAFRTCRLSGEFTKL